MARQEIAPVSADGRPRVALLARGGPSTNVLYHALSEEFSIDPVIVESGSSRLAMIRRRARRLGWATVVGQVLFASLVRPALARRSRARRARILAAAGLSDAPITAPVMSVASANDPEVTNVLRDRPPQAIVVSGTRILSAALLRSVPSPFINVHAGITPRYRGVHGAYWALANGDAAGCGVTVHLVDVGIDTGPVIAQARVRPDHDDDFTTYPELQLVAAVPMLRAAVRAAAMGRLVPLTPQPPGPSRLWSHPTLWYYLWQRLTRGVR